VVVVVVEEEEAYLTAGSRCCRPQRGGREELTGAVP